MVSKTAEADVEDMWEAGLKPTFRDIVRLNALALEVERTQGSFALSKPSRVAFLGSVAFREPTIGSEVWLAQASQLFDESDVQTFLIIRAFSLSMPQEKLPDPCDENAVTAAIQRFKGSVGFATLPQIMSAVEYAMHGFDGSACETPAKRKDVDEENDGGCYEIGLLRQGMVYRLGSAADLKDLPPRACQEMLMQAMSREHSSDVRKDMVSRAEDDYLRTLDEITDRLKTEKNDGD